MKRREALRQASLILGYTLTAPAILGVLNGCKPEPKITIDPNWKPQFFAKDQIKSLVAIVDTFIPKTDSPSASEVGVVEFLDSMYATILKPEAKKLFAEGLIQLGNITNGKSFDSLTASERNTAMSKLESKQLPLLKDNKPNNVFYTALRGLVVTGYMLSEKIGTEYLAYDPVPGNYEGCIPLERNGGVNWSLN